MHPQGPPAGGPAFGQILVGGGGAVRRFGRPPHAHFGAGLMALNVVAPPNLQNHPAPPQPDPEPAGLPNGGVISIPCTALKIEVGTNTPLTARGLARPGVVEGGLRQEYDKYVIHQTPDPFSMCAPSDDILLWTSRSGQEITVVNTRLQMVTKHNQFRTSPSSTGIVLSRRCVMYTNDNGFIVFISPTDKTFRLIYEFELRILINGQILRMGRQMAGRSTHLLADNETIVHLLVQPALALKFKISDIKENIRRGQHTIAPFEVHNLAGLPSQIVTNRADPLESAIMMLDNRILLGGPILNTTHLDWAWFDIENGQVRNERVYDGPNGGPTLHPHFLLKLRLNPLNLYEIYVHIINPLGNIAEPRERRLAKGELWVMGMSTKNHAFQWKRRERPPCLDNPNYRQLTQTPIDWTRTPDGTMYIRWCDFEGLGPGDENIMDFRSCRSFTLTRVENTISPLTAMAGRVLQGFDRLPFPLPRHSFVPQLQDGHGRQRALISTSDRHRAGSTGVTTAADFVRYSIATLIHQTSHIYYDDEQVYDDTEELIEKQRQAISQMTKKTPFRSIFGTLFSAATRLENPVDELPAPAPVKRDKKIKKEDGSGDGVGEGVEEERGVEQHGLEAERDEEPGPSQRQGRRRRSPGEDSLDEREERMEEERLERMERDRIERRQRMDQVVGRWGDPFGNFLGDRIIDSDDLLAFAREGRESPLFSFARRADNVVPPRVAAALATERDAANAQRAADAAAARILARHEQPDAAAAAADEEQAAMLADDDDGDLVEVFAPISRRRHPRQESR